MRLVKLVNVLDISSTFIQTWHSQIKKFKILTLLISAQRTVTVTNLALTNSQSHIT